MIAWGKREEEPGPHIPLTWSTSHLLPFTSHGISSLRGGGGSAFCTALPHLSLDQLGTLGQVTKFLDTSELTENENELDPPYP